MRVVHSIRLSKVFYRPPFEGICGVYDILDIEPIESQMDYTFIITPANLLDMDTLEKETGQKGVRIYTAYEQISPKVDKVLDQSYDEDGSGDVEEKEDFRSQSAVHGQLCFDGSSICI